MSENMEIEQARQILDSVKACFADKKVNLSKLSGLDVLSVKKCDLEADFSELPSELRNKIEHVTLTQSYTSLGKKKVSVDVEKQTASFFSASLKLQSGKNLFELSLFDKDSESLGTAAFELTYKSFFREWNETIFIALALALIIRALIIQAFWIPTGSMEPTLLGQLTERFSQKVTRPGDQILVSRCAYVMDFSLDGRLPFLPRIPIKLPKRGDVVVFRFPIEMPGEPPKDYIKRVIGLPGDKVQVYNFEVYVNDQILKEPYIKDPPFYDYGPVTVPEDSLFVLGDNRNNSSDGHDWGFLPLSHLKGQAVLIYNPFKRFGPIKSIDPMPDNITK